ncbi:MAG: CmcI family methyltransferase, partial [Alphaproteobacteria bacterium]
MRIPISTNALSHLFLEKIGTYTANKETKLSKKEQKIVNDFHNLYYTKWENDEETVDVSWLGYHALKCPLDLWIYQEIITQTRPHIIIETGTHKGGSALYLASICQLVGEGCVLSIDIAERDDRPKHKLVHYINGSSIKKETIEKVEKIIKRIVPNETPRILVILDSDHTEEHVLEEMNIYNCLVPFSRGVRYSELKEIDLCRTFYIHAPRPRQESEK